MDIAGIPVGKTALYCAAGGFNPKRTLPVQLDLGTDNPDLLSDPLYLGHHTPRLKGSEHLRIVEEFCDAISHKFPNALVQFEVRNWSHFDVALMVTEHFVDSIWENI